MILPADKLKGMLETSIYQRLGKDPMAAQKIRLSRKLKEFKKGGEIIESLYNRLRPFGSQPPRIYGLPKIHKPEVPLRPIVSCIRSPSYQLSRYITSLMSPLAGKMDSHVRNSRHFVEVMRCLRIEDDEVLVSFDVTSLFTNVPVDETVWVIYDRLQNNRTTLSPNRVAELL